MFSQLKSKAFFMFTNSSWKVKKMADMALLEVNLSQLWHHLLWTQPAPQIGIEPGP
jgi:hypothetical protein